MGTLNNNLLLDGFDSKLIRPRVPLSENEKKSLVRTRLIGMVQILFGGAIVVPEGWALDSKAFLIIGSEIATAYNEAVKARQKAQIYQAPRPPLIMETKREQDYLAVFDHYISRPEVRWLAFRPYFDDADVREALSRKIAESKGRDAEGFFNEVDSCVKSKDLRDGMPPDQVLYPSLRLIAEYFGKNSKRFIPSQMTKGIFQKAFKEQLATFTNSYNKLPHRDAVSEEIFEIALKGQDPKTLFPTSSSAIDFIDQNCSLEVVPHLRELITTSFLRVCSSQTGSDFVTPPATQEACLPVWLENHAFETNQEINGELYVASAAASKIEFDIRHWDNHPVVHKISRQSLDVDSGWEKLWSRVIFLANSEDWTTKLRKFHEKVYEQGLPRALDKSQFRKLEEALHEQIPELVVRQSAVDRIRVALTGKGGDPRTNKIIGAIAGLGASLAVEKAANMLAHVDIGSHMLLAAVMGTGTFVGLHAGGAVDIDPGSLEAVALSRRNSALRAVAQRFTNG